MQNSGMFNQNTVVPVNIGRTMPTTQRQVNLKTTTNQNLNMPNSILSAINQNGQHTTTAQQHINKSFNFDLYSQVKQQQQQNIPYNKVEHLQKNGCHAVYACGQLTRQRYINPKLEKELHDFKIEVEDKFLKSPIARFNFPRISIDEEGPNENIDSYSQDQNLNDLSTYLAEAEVKIQKQKKGAKTGRKLVQHSSILNYQTEVGLSKNEPSAQISINYDQNAYESQSIVNTTTIPSLKKSQKYDQQLEQILKNTGMFGTSTTLTVSTLNNNNQQIGNKNRNILRKNDSTLYPSQTGTSRFKDSTNNLRMPELSQAPKLRYQDLLLQNAHASHSQDRYQKKQSNKQILNNQQQGRDNSTLNSGKITNNIINLNNPQVIIQSPQNNTFILVDSKLKDNSRNIINQLEKNGYIQNKFDSVNDKINAHINKSFNGNVGGSGINSFRNLQESRIFDQYVKQKNLNIGGGQGNMAQSYMNNQRTSRNKINISQTNKSKAKFETNRSTVRNHNQGDLNQSMISNFTTNSQNQYKNLIARELNQSNDHVSKSFVFPSAKQPLKN